MSGQHNVVCRVAVGTPSLGVPLPVLDLEPPPMEKLGKDFFEESQPSFTIYRDEVIAESGRSGKGSLPEVQLFDEANREVQQSGRKVNWWVFGALAALSFFLLGAFGWIYYFTCPKNEVESSGNEFGHYKEVPGARPEHLFASLEKEYERSFEAGSLDEGLVTRAGHSYIRSEVDGAYKTIHLQQKNPQQIEKIDAELFQLISLCESPVMEAKRALIEALGEGNERSISRALSYLLKGDRPTSDASQEKLRKERIQALVQLRLEMVTDADYPLTAQFYGQVNTGRFPYRLFFGETEMTELPGVQDAHRSIERLRQESYAHAVENHGTFLLRGEKNKLFWEVSRAEDPQQALANFQRRFDEALIEQLGGDEGEAKLKSKEELVSALRRLHIFVPNVSGFFEKNLAAIYAEHQDPDVRWLAIREKLLNVGQYLSNKANEYREQQGVEVLQTVEKRRVLEALAAWGEHDPKQGVPRPKLSEPVAIAQAYLAQHFLSPILTTEETDLIGTLGMIPITRPGSQRVTLLPAQDPDREYPLGRVYPMRSEEIVDVTSASDPSQSRSYRVIEDVEITKKSILGDTDPCLVRVRRQFIPLDQ